jgi:hypothetical protein
MFSPAIVKLHSWHPLLKYSRKLSRSQYMICYIVTVSFQKSSLDVVRVNGQGLHRWHHRYIQQQNPHCRGVPWPCQGTWLFESQCITKLSSYGDHVITSGWFKSYLFNRKQSVNIRSPNSNHYTSSNWGIASMGVPQASCHSSLHSNTHRTVTSESKPVLCANDTSVIIYDPVKELFQNFINDVFDSCCLKQTRFKHGWNKCHEMWH